MDSHTSPCWSFIVDKQQKQVQSLLRGSSFCESLFLASYICSQKAILKKICAIIKCFFLIINSHNSIKNNENLLDFYTWFK